MNAPPRRSGDSVAFGQPATTTAWVCSILIMAGLSLAHGALIWMAMEGWEGINGDWPLWRDDHPLYFHSALVTRDFLGQSGTTAGYDPSFMAGYAKSVVFPASSTLPELIVAGFGGRRPELAYKLYVLGSAALIPWLMAASAIVWRAGPSGSVAAVCAFLIYVWTDFPINYAAFGMLPYLLAIPLGLLASGVFARFVESGGLRWWVGSVALMTLVVLVHFTSVMIVAPTSALIYFAQVFSGRREPMDRLSSRAHLGVWLIPGFVILINAFWWLPGLWLASTKGASDFAFAHPEGVLIRLRQIWSTEPIIERWLWVTGMFGGFALARHPSRGLVGLVGFTGFGFFWGYLAGGFRSLDFLQPGRHTYACYSALCLVAGVGVGAILHRLRRVKPVRLDLLALGLILGGTIWQFGEISWFSARVRVLAPIPFLSSRPSPRLLWVFSRVKRHLKPGDRIFYEEGGFAIPGLPDPFQGGRFSGLLPWRLGVEVVGGPYLHASLTTNFTQFGEDKLFGKERWDRPWFTRYARLYRPAAILCWTPWARAFCKANPDLVEIKEDDGVCLLGRVLGFEGAAVEGRAKVLATPGRLRVSDMKAGVDGSVVLRYHSLPCLRSDPPVTWEPVYLEGDPVPFLRLRPTPGTVTFRLSVPPTTQGAAVR